MKTIKEELFEMFGAVVIQPELVHNEEKIIHTFLKLLDEFEQEIREEKEKTK